MSQQSYPSLARLRVALVSLALMLFGVPTLCCAGDLRLNIADIAFSSGDSSVSLMSVASPENPYEDEEALADDTSSLGKVLKYSREVWLRGFGLAKQTDYATLKLGVRMQKDIGTLRFWESDDLRTANLQPIDREPQLYFSFSRSW
jgi:hypothetical protein